MSGVTTLIGSLVILFTLIGIDTIVLGLGIIQHDILYLISFIGIFCGTYAYFASRNIDIKIVFFVILFRWAFDLYYNDDFSNRSTILECGFPSIGILIIG